MSNQKKKTDHYLVRYISITLLAFGIVGVYALLALNLKVFSPVAKAIGDYSFEDFYYQILGSTSEQDTSRVVTIVDMTEQTDRRQLAELMMEVESFHPKVMGIDIVYEGLKEDTIGNQMVKEAAKECHTAVFAYKLIDRTDEAIHSFFMPDDSIKEGFVNMPRQLYGGLKRSLSIGRTHQGELYPSFLKLVADQYADQEVVELADKELRINFTPKKFQVVHYDSLYEYKHLITDRIVLLGAMKEESDMHYTPLGKMAGTELLAFGVETLLKNNKVVKFPTWLSWIVSFVVALIAVILRSLYLQFAKNERRHPLVSALLSTELAIGLVVFVIVAMTVWVSFILFCKFNVSVNLGFAIAAMAFAFTATNLYETIVKLFNKKIKKKS